jgi:hypothetical protein
MFSWKTFGKEKRYNSEIHIICDLWNINLWRRYTSSSKL